MQNYLYREKPGSQFLPAKCEKKHPRKSNIPHPTSKNQSTGFSTSGLLELVKMC